MKGIQRFFAGWLMFLAISGLCNVYVYAMDTGWVERLFGKPTIWTVIPALIVALLYFVVWIPSLAWRWFVAYKVSGFATFFAIALCFLIWDLIRPSSRIRSSRIPAFLSRASQHVLYFIFADVLHLHRRPQLSNEREIAMDSTNDPPPGRGESDQLENDVTEKREALERRMEAFAGAHPDLLPEVKLLPVNRSTGSLQGFFDRMDQERVIKRLQLNKQTMKEYNELRAEWLKYVGFEAELERKRQESVTARKETELLPKKIKAQESELDAKIAQNQQAAALAGQAVKAGELSLEEKELDIKLKKMKLEEAQKVRPSQQQPPPPTWEERTKQRFGAVADVEISRKRWKEEAQTENEREAIDSFCDDAVDKLLHGEKP